MRVMTAESPTLLSGFALGQNVPNPFLRAGSTIIRFSLPVAGTTRLALYDAYGREVRILAEGQFEGGVHTVSFDASGLESGTYFYRLSSGSAALTKRMVVLE